MIPILYATDETSFTSNGVGRLVEAISCKVTEERNGIYELEMRYPITGELYQTMVETGGYIGATHDDNHDVQPFLIYRYTAPLNGVVTFYAHHLSYALSNIILRPFSATSITDLFNQIPAQSVNSNPFTFWTDKVVATPYTLSVPSAVRQILHGQEGSILDVYGKGEYKFDKYDVKLYVNRGSNTGVTIAYGKNLSDLKRDTDYSGTYDAVAPFWTGDGGTVYLPEIIVSYGLGTDAVPLDLSGDFDSMPTEQELRAKAQSYLTNNEPWIPDENITINFVQLWQTEDYKNVAALERVGLCDRVSVYYSALGVTAENQEIIKVVYNTLLDRYDSMEIGKLQTTLGDTITSIARAQTAGLVSTSILQSSIDKATQLITGGLGGYVVFSRNAAGQPQEILVMDTDDPLTAVSVIRINKNGIGFSTSGINGPYSTAWTIDGSFNADYITTGVLDGSLIRAGTIASLDGSTFYLDLENGILNMDASQLTLNGDDMSVIIQGHTQPIAADLDELRAHIVIGSDGSMTFVGADNNPITLRLVNDSLVIYNGGTAIDTFGSGGTVTENLTIADGGSFTQGNFRWIVRSTGRMDLVYVG